MPLEGGFFMRKMNRIIRTLFAFFLLIGLAWPAQAKKLKVRVGYFPNITHAQALVGMGNGYFAQTPVRRRWRLYSPNSWIWSMSVLTLLSIHISGAKAGHCVF
jgi:ABC-type nitrate/sulfonate/bicarbonate transport system substrate-binding protein